MTEYSYKKDTVKLVEDDYVLGTTTISFLKSNGVECIIIEADHKSNPTDYTEFFFNKLKKTIKEDQKRLYVDLSNLYGVKSKNWFYQWVWKLDKNNRLKDEEFIPIDKVSHASNLEYQLIKTYIYNKFKVAKT